MNEIKCPHCGEIFQVDPAGYAAIVAQVRTEQFSRDVQDRSQAIHRELEAKQQTALTAADALRREQLAEKEKEITRLQEQAKAAEKERLLAVAAAVHEKESEIAQLREQLFLKRQEAEIREESLREAHKTEVARLEAEVEQYRDFKARQSTKMIGESLEQHCLVSFNQVRMMAFPNAYFEKDNDVVEGTKGDFIFREETVDGVPLLSIMFEMKNEADATERKHKNEDFLDKLDKDRKKKGCEYAVLVSMLEMDNEYYNTGIVDMSYRHEKMYVIRPQFFIPLISLLRNAALANVQTKRELAAMQRQDLDVRKFEQAMLDFKDKFGKNYQLANQHFEKAIKEIDSVIDGLEKVKEFLTKSNMQLGRANDKAQELSIKSLTKGNATMRERFEEAGVSIS